MAIHLYCKQIVMYFIKGFARVLKLFLRLRLSNFILCLFLGLGVILMIRTCKNPEDTVQEVLEEPILLWWTDGFPAFHGSIECGNQKCIVFNDPGLMKKYDIGAFLFYGSNTNFDNLPLPRKTKDNIWAFYHEESPRNVAEFMHEPVLRLFNYSSTFSSHSHVPFPLQYLDSIEDITSTKYYIKTEEKNALLLKEELAPILYLQSDCDTATERDKYVEELMKYIKIDSYGNCLNNKELPSKFKQDYLNNLNEDSFLKFIARYKFVVAIENGICEDYVTEKLWRAIKVGVVPLYFGSPTVKNWLPNEKSAILLQDYPTIELMSNYLNKLLAKDNLYKEHLEHKEKQWVKNERLKTEFNKNPNQNDALQTVNKFQCFVCEKLHEKKAGLKEVSIVTKSHYNCPKHVSALTQQANPQNDWMYSWEMARRTADKLYDMILNET